MVLAKIYILYNHAGRELKFQPCPHVWASTSMLPGLAEAEPCSLGLKTQLLWRALPLPLSACINNEASTISLIFLHTLSVVCSLGHTLPSSGFSQPQLSLCVCPLKSKFQHSVPAHTNRLLAQAGECRKVAWSLCSGLCLFGLLLAPPSL